jgi:hypothetical protein
VGAEGEAQKDYWYWQDEVLERCVKEVQEWIQVNLYSINPYLTSMELTFCGKGKTQ